MSDQYIKNILIEPMQEELEEYLTYKSANDFFENLESGIEKLKYVDIPLSKHMVLICGGMVGFDKGLIDFNQ